MLMLQRKADNHVCLLRTFRLLSLGEDGEKRKNMLL